MIFFCDFFFPFEEQIKTKKSYHESVKEKKKEDLSEYWRAASVS